MSTPPDSPCHPSSVIRHPEFSSLLIPLTPGPHLAIAISGGADSTCLALLAAEWAKANGHRITALTVDHGLRAESAHEAKQVAQWMRAAGIPHHTLTLQPLSGKQNLQARARDARYALLAAWCKEHKADLLTAHHVNDQAETLLIRLKRGSHITGLAGIAPVSEMHGVRLLRPLLSIPKSRLIATLETRNHPWIEDPSNAVDAYERTRARKLLADLPNAETVAAQLARTAERLRSVREAEEKRLDALSHHLLFFKPDHLAECAKALLGLPPADAALLLSRALLHVSGETYPPRFAQAEAAVERMRSGKRTTLHGCLISYRKKEGIWRISREMRLEEELRLPHIRKA